MIVPDLPLHPIPRPNWQAEYDSIWNGSEYIRGKYDRRPRIRELCEFAAKYCLRLLQPPESAGVFVDVGPGPGEMMEVARHYGWLVSGIDSPCGFGGMGDAYHELSRLMHERQYLPVDMRGWQNVVAMPGTYRSVGVFLFRGSWEQCYAEHLTGPPHHEHHKATLQNWDFNDELLEKWRAAFRFMRGWLVSGGIILNHANGVGSADNQVRYAVEIQKAAIGAGLVLDYAEGLRLHRWKKP